MKFFHKTALSVMSLLLISPMVLAGEGAQGGGGGGDVLLAEPTTPTHVEGVARRAGFSLLSIFTDIENEAENLVFNNSGVAEEYSFRRAFTAQPSIYDLLSRTGDIDFSRADCEDPHDQSLHDGGAEGSGVTGRICISPTRLLAKANSMSVYRYTMALVAHELGHLAGLNEREATMLQSLVSIKLAQFIPAYWEESRTESARRMLVLLRLADNAVHRRENANSRRDYLAVCQRIVDIYRERLGFTNLSTLLRPADYEEFRVTQLKVRQLLGACRNDLIGDYELDYARSTYEMFAASFGHCDGMVPISMVCDEYDWTFVSPRLTHITNIRSSNALTDLRYVASSIRMLLQHSEGEVFDCGGPSAASDRCWSFLDSN